MKKIYDEIDQLISIFKTKGDSSEFSFEDSKAILCLEIVRLEINEFGKVTDRSWGAFGSIAGWSYHYNLGINNDIHERILNLHIKIDQLNDNEFKADIKVPTGNDRKDWYNYFGGAIRYLMENK